jgi:DNA recombination protein RmuC
MNSAAILLLVIGGFVALAIFIDKKLKNTQRDKPSQEILDIITMLQTSSQQDRTVLLDSLQRNSESLNIRLDNAAKVISDVQKNVGELGEIGRSMRDLQSFLQSPKLRGNVGEHVLKELLGQMLPKSSFHLQYSFKSGHTVDAAIKTSGGIIPIDSKFPMENFRKMSDGRGEVDQKIAAKQFIRDVKTHIDTISKKYILTDEGTIDYALMYIPSEAVYYEIVNNPKLFDYAGEKRVLPVSPTTFYAYMKSILMSFEGAKVAQEAKQILASLRAIKKDYGKLETNIVLLGKHLGNATKAAEATRTSLTTLGHKLDQTANLSSDTEKKIGA